MDVLSMAKEGIAHASGNVEKAIIEIIDMRGRTVTVEPPVPIQGNSIVSGGFSSSGFLKAADTFAGSAALTDSVNSLKENAGLGVGNNTFNLLSRIEDSTRKLFYVQFNPNELSLSGYGGGLTQKTNYSEKGNNVSFDKVEVRITLNVKLIFDKVDPQDAFMADKANMSTTAMATGAAKGVKTALGKKDNSVQKEVEGFVAALRSKYTRRITFHWGTMNYTGVLNRVSSQYTMFNVLGQPIRAYVNLSLVCADQGVSPNSMGVWQKQYQELFGLGNQSYVKSAQKVGNLLNFNL